MEHKAFIVHVVALNIDLGDKIYPLKRDQIVYLKKDKAFTKVLSEYANFADIFSPKLAAELPKHIRINDYAIELVNN